MMVLRMAKFFLAYSLIKITMTATIMKTHLFLQNEV